MALTLSDRCLNISPSVTLAIDSQAKEMRARGEDVIGFGAGEPDFGTPEYIVNAAKEALDAGMNAHVGKPFKSADLAKALDELQRDDDR